MSERVWQVAEEAGYCKEDAVQASRDGFDVWLNARNLHAGTLLGAARPAAVVMMMPLPW